MSVKPKDMFLFFRLRKHYSHIRSLNYNCEAQPIFSRFSKVDPLILQTNYKRSFALKVYSQYLPQNELLSTKIFEYIKEQNSLESMYNISSISNVFDKKNAIQQLKLVLIHSVQPSPDDVIKLFSLFDNSSRSTIHQTFNSEESKDILRLRIESIIPQMSLIQLHQFALSLKNLLSTRLKVFRQFSEITFEECLSRAESSEVLSDSFKYFLIGTELYGNAISKKAEYSGFISVFEKQLESANPFQLTQLLHFLGLSKKLGSSLNLPIIASRSLFPHFKELSFVDAGIAASGVFKLGIKFEKDDPLAPLVAQKLIERTSTKCQSWSLTSLESFALVSMVKYLRFTLHRNEDTLRSVKLFVSKLEEESFNPQLVCHLLALYANSNYYDSEIYDLLVEKFYHYLNSVDQIVRIKDISRVMWAISHVQHQCKEAIYDAVIKNLEDFSETGELSLHASHVVDSTLALTTLEVYPKDLIHLLLQPSIVKSIRGKNRSRYLSRLLVLSQVQKTLFPTSEISVPIPSDEELPLRTISDECFHRPSIKRIQSSLHWLQQECGAQILKLKFLIPHINYCSIILTNRAPKDPNLTSEIGKRVLADLSPLEDSLIAIDVNDANTTLGGPERKVIGMEALKRALLRRQGWKVHVLSSDDVEGCGDDVQALAALIVKTVLRKD